MKIALISGEFPPMEGGVGAYTQEIAKAFHNKGHEVHVITSRQARPSDIQRSISTLKDPYDLPYASLYAQIGHWRWSDLAKITDLILRYDIEIVDIQYQAAAYNMNNPAINFLPWRLKGVCNSVVTFHDLRVPYLFPKAGKLRQTAVRFMAKQAAGVIVTNNDDFQELSRLISNPITQIPIGSNIDTYTPNHLEIKEVYEDLKITPADFLLGYFGFLNESKGAETLLKALAQLDNHYHLVFVGGQTGASDATNAAYRDIVKKMVEELGMSSRVHWTGFLSDNRVSAYLHAAKLIVMPYQDGVSLRRGTLMATLAHGRPLISTTPSSPIDELKNGINIWLVPPNDEHALADAILMLSTDPKLCEEMGKAAAETAGSFTWDKIGNRTLQFFESLIGARGNS